MYRGDTFLDVKIYDRREQSVCRQQEFSNVVICCAETLKRCSACMSLVPFLYYTLVKRASERKQINRVSRRATSQRAFTMESDAATRRSDGANLRDGLQTARGEGFARFFSSGRVQ
jgi:hypothetical protein